MHVSLHFARKGQAEAKHFMLEDTLLGQSSRKFCCKNLHLVKLFKIHPHTKFYKTKKEGERKSPLPLAYVFSFCSLLRWDSWYSLSKLQSNLENMVVEKIAQAEGLSRTSLSSPLILCTHLPFRFSGLNKENGIP